MLGLANSKVLMLMQNCQLGQNAYLKHFTHLHKITNTQTKQPPLDLPICTGIP
jgi:hypothetical protein